MSCQRKRLGRRGDARMNDKFPYYTKDLDSSRPSVKAIEIDTLSMGGVDDPAGYIPSPDLAKAVNVALILGRPLLITGDPGTGKTQLAFSLAHEIGVGVPYKFETKSTSVARDLFYSFDAIAAFHATEKDRKPTIEYVTFQALGLSIIEAYHKDRVKHLLPTDSDRYTHPGEPRRSVVLIDEVDKAPRDFPNDLLNEIDRMYFRIAEADYASTPGASGKPNDQIDPNLRPIVIITSNSEKSLPDPFLRRCVFHHIPFPKYPKEKEEVEKIVDGRFKGVRFPAGTRESALKLFWQLRGEEGGPSLRKPPSIAELLDWLRLLGEFGRLGTLRSQREVFLGSIGVLVKQAEDREQAKRFIESNWK